MPYMTLVKKGNTVSLNCPITGCEFTLRATARKDFYWSDRHTVWDYTSLWNHMIRVHNPPWAGFGSEVYG